MTDTAYKQLMRSQDAGLNMLERSERQRKELDKAYQELKESEENFKALFDCASDGILVTDINTGKFLASNAMMSRMLGYSAEELRDLCLKDINPESNLPFVVESIRKMTPARELPLKRKDGSIFYVDVGGNSVVFSKQTVQMGVFRDLTESKRAEDALRAQNKTFSHVLNGLNALVYVADMKTHEILFVNKYGKKVWGDITGKICWQTIQTGRTGPCEFCTNSRLVGPDGTPTEGVAWEFQNTVNKRWYDCRDRAIYWPDGRIVRMEIATDITGRKAMEKQLLEAEKLDAIGYFITGTAHELNNPLATMISFSETMLGKLKGAAGDEGKLRESAEVVLRNAIRCEAIVTSLMAYGRTQASQFVLVDVNELIEKSLSLAEKVRGLKNITIRRNYSADMPLVMGSREQLEQIFANIIQNAAHAMHDRGALEIETKTEGGNVCAVFTDSGEGILPENLHQIFDPFFTTREPGQGTGLGLSVSAGIIRAHSGCITAASEGKGKGASFTVSLPIPAAAKAMKPEDE